MNAIYDLVANFGDAYGLLLVKYAVLAQWFCLALMIAWVLWCGFLKGSLRAGQCLIACAALLALGGFFHFMPLRISSWKPYLVTTEWFLVPAFIIALVGMFLIKGEKTNEAERGAKSFDRADWMWLAGLFVVALIMRVYRLAELPRCLYYEHAETAGYAIQALITGKPYMYHAFTADSWQHMYFLKSHFLYVTDLWALAFAIFGVSMSVFRGTIVFVGLGCIVLLYTYVRREYGAWEARIATALAAISVWHLALSRDGWMVLIVSVLQLTALLLLWAQALRTAKWGWYVAGAILLAISIYGYRINYFFPPLIVGWTLYVALREGKSFWRRHWLKLAVSVGVFLLLSIPYIHYIITHKYFALLTTQAVWGADPTVPGANGWVRLWNKILVMFGDEAIYARSGQGWRLNIVPAWGGVHGWLFNPLTSVLALVGLAESLRRVREERYFVVLLALFLVPIPALFSHPVSRRIVLLVVPMHILAGIGGYRLVESLRAGLPERVKRLPLLLLWVAIGMALTLNASGFRHVINARGYIEPLPIAQLTAKLIDRNYVYVVTEKGMDRAFLEFATYAKTGKDFGKFWQLVPCSLVDRTTYLVSTGYKPVIDKGYPAVFLLQWSSKLGGIEEQVGFWEAAREELPGMSMRVVPLYREAEPFERTRILALKMPAESVVAMPLLLERFYRAPELLGTEVEDDE